MHAHADLGRAAGEQREHMDIVLLKFMRVRQLKVEEAMAISGHTF